MKSRRLKGLLKSRGSQIKYSRFRCGVHRNKLAQCTSESGHFEPQTSAAKTHLVAGWNKGKLIGAKPPLRAKHVWAIRTNLLVEGRTRDLAMFNLAIDSKLRGCDIVALRVEDVAPNGYAIERATVRQKKTGQPVKFELTEQTGKRSTTT
jgi:hypothetical protein